MGILWLIELSIAKLKMENNPLTIEETQNGLRKKKYSAVELVDSYLGNIQEYDKEINSFITVTEDEAYAGARNVDKLIADYGDKAFVDYPLLGVSLSHKDLFLSKGVRTTAGSKALDSYIPPYSATVVDKLDKAGCILIGKNNCDAWAHGSSGENSDFGPTKNPWNKKYVPGGSSSGSAAAVSAGFALASTGTDTGGSVRLPANFCGIVGLKPTYGVVSRFGVVAMASSLDSVGNFGHCSGDVKKVFDLVKGTDGADSTLINSAYNSPKSHLRLGFPKEYFIKGIDSAVEKSVFRAMDVFRKGGIEVTGINLPHTQYANSVYYIVMSAEVSSNLGRYDAVRYGASRETFGDEAKRRIMLGTYVLSAGYYDAYYLKAQKVRSKIIQDFDKAFASVDAIIAPVSPTPPFKLGEKSSDPLQMYLADVFTVSASLAGIPSLALPFEFNKEKLPLGFQLMGPRFSENMLFTLGKLFESATDYKPAIAII